MCIRDSLLLKICLDIINKNNIDINKFNPPDDSEIEDILNEYTSFSENVLMTKMSQIFNEDIFDKARVNLSNLAL